MEMGICGSSPCGEVYWNISVAASHSGLTVWALNPFNRACTTIPIVETEDLYSLVVVHCYASKSTDQKSSLDTFLKPTPHHEK